MSAQRIVNIADLPLNDAGDGKDFVAKVGRAGPVLGSTGLGCSLVVVPPGKGAWPFHRHHVIHELFYVLSGEGETRIGDERKPVKAGDLIAAPAGAEAHQIVNTGEGELRYLAISTIGEVDIVEYPDSGKTAFGAMTPGADGKPQLLRGIVRNDKQATYWEGE